MPLPGRPGRESRCTSGCPSLTRCPTCPCDSRFGGLLLPPCGKNGELLVAFSLSGVSFKLAKQQGRQFYNLATPYTGTRDQNESDSSNYSYYIRPASSVSTACGSEPESRVAHYVLPVKSFFGCVDPQVVGKLKSIRFNASVEVPGIYSHTLTVFPCALVVQW